MNFSHIIGYLIFFSCFLGVFVVLPAYASHLWVEDIKGFCQENGYTSYDQETNWGDNDYFCMRVEDNYKIRQPIDKCDNEWCFIKTNDAYVEVDE